MKRAVQKRRREEQEKKRGKKETLICFSESLKCLADMLSVSEVRRGGDCIDGFYLQVESERERKGAALERGKLAMQKSAINHRVQFAPTEN